MNAIRPDPLPATQARAAASQGRAAGSLARLVPVAGALAMAIVIGGFYLFREHLAPAESEWLYLLLLACPLIHLFAHGGSDAGATPAGGASGESAPRHPPTPRAEGDPAAAPEVGAWRARGSTER